MLRKIVPGITMIKIVHLEIDCNQNYSYPIAGTLVLNFEYMWNQWMDSKNVSRNGVLGYLMGHLSI